MKGVNRFCPRTGTRLSDEQHHDQHGASQRHPVDDLDPDHWGDPPLGQLTNGELVSSRVALANYFRRMHQRRHDPDDALYRAMALAVRRLKSETDAWDVWVWYALAERLDRKGFAVGWMLDHVEARCPRCAGPLRWEETPRGQQPQCAQNCRGEWNRSYLDGVIREHVRSTYNQAFAADADEGRGRERIETARVIAEP